jgi:hypothetical protein
MSHGWQEAFAQAARSTTEHDFKAVEFSHRLTTLCFIAAFCFVVYTYVIHMLQGFRTEDRLPFPCSTRMRHSIITIASLANHRDSTNPTTSSPRNLACRYITELSQWKAVAYTGHIPGHSGLRCRSIYRRTLELSYAQATCHLQESHPTRWARICRHCNTIHACECSRDERSMIWPSWQRAAAFPYTKIDRDCVTA